MAWFRLDDKSCFNPKVLAAGNAAWGTFCRAGAWSSETGTDGAIPASVAKTIEPSGRVWAQLVSAGLVTATPTGYLIPKFTEFNPTAEQVAARRADRSKAGALGGERSAQRRSYAKQKLEKTDRSDSDGASKVQASAQASACPNTPIGQASAQASACPNEPQTELLLKHISTPDPRSHIDQISEDQISPSQAPAPKRLLGQALKPKRTPHPRFSEVVAAYSTHFEAARGTKPAFDAKDGRHINQLLARMGGDADRAISVIRAAFTADPFKARNATIATIAADPSKYVTATQPLFDCDVPAPAAQSPERLAKVQARVLDDTNRLIAEAGDGKGLTW